MSKKKACSVGGVNRRSAGNIGCLFAAGTIYGQKSENSLAAHCTFVASYAYSARCAP